MRGSESHNARTERFEVVLSKNSRNGEKNEKDGFHGRSFKSAQTVDLIIFSNLRQS